MKLTILTTGGTIEKTYNEFEGSLGNTRSVLDEILGLLRLPDLFIRHIPVMHKDSLDMTDLDRKAIEAAVRNSLPSSDGILILHGTDTLSVTGEHLYRNIPDLTIPIVLTGAMRPYEFRDSDALQNVTEALLSLRLIPPGVYVVMHNKVLPFPGVVKDKQSLSFRQRNQSPDSGRENQAQGKTP